MNQVKYYVCELHNVESHAGQIDFGRGLKLKQLASQLVGRLDRVTKRLPRWKEKKPWFLVNGHSVNGDSWVNGDPSGALRVFKIALLLHFGEGVQFGPDVHISKQLQRYAIGPIIYRGGELSQIMPVCRPDEFIISQADVFPLQTLFEQLVNGFKAPLLRIPIDRFIKAVVSKANPSDAIIDQSIALEALYLQENDSKKQKPLASRGAAFLGVDDASRKQIYCYLRCFYQARNSVIHEGKEHPTVALKSGASKGCVELRDWCFTHLREAIRKLLSDNKYLIMDKGSFVNELKNSAKVWASQFQRIDSLYF